MRFRVRRLYSLTALRLLASGDVPRFARLARGVADAVRAIRAGRAPRAPVLVSLFATFRCNHDCFMCATLATAAGHRKAGRAEADTDGMRRIVDEVARMGAVALSLTGGEPLLRRDAAEILAHARARGLWTHLNTNGFLLDAARAREIAAAGVDSVNISLDGATAGVHDRLRRHAGSFEGVRAAVGHLRTARGASRAPLVTLVHVVGRHNPLDAVRVAALARDWGADGVGYMPLNTFAVDGGLRLLPDPEPGDVGPTVAALKKDPFVDSTPGYLDLFERCLRGEPLPRACRAGYLSMTLDCFGNVYRCFPYGLHGIPEPGFAGAGPAAAWRSGRYQALRRGMEECRECYWNCHTEMGLAVAPLTENPKSRASIPPKSP